MKRLFVLVAAFVAAIPAALAQSQPETPAVLPGGTVVSVDDAKKLLDGKAASFFDMRNAINYGKGHIPGAVQVTYREKSDFKPDFDASQDQVDLNKLPADKNAKIVFYSHGAEGWKSYKAAVLSIKEGRKNVMWMRTGLNAWSAKGYPTE